MCMAWPGHLMRVIIVADLSNVWHCAKYFTSSDSFDACEVTEYVCTYVHMYVCMYVSVLGSWHMTPETLVIS